MNIASDPKSLDTKSIPSSTLLSPEANQAAALASATGVLTVDLDAIVANWRKLEKTAVPSECAGVVKADAYGCGADQVARALATPAARHSSSPPSMKRAWCEQRAPTATIYTLDGFFQNTGDTYAAIDCKARDRRPQRARRMGRVLPPLRLVWRRGHSYRHRHEPAWSHHGRGAGHHPPHQCRRSRHHAGHEPPRLRRDCSTIRSTPGSSRLSAKSPACFRAYRPRWRIPPACISALHSSSTWCGRERRSTASILLPNPTIRCSRSSI